MNRHHFVKQGANPNQIHDEIKRQYPDLNSDTLRVEFLDDDIWITVDDSLLDAVTAVVEAHVPIEPVYPDWHQFRNTIRKSPAFKRILGVDPITASDLMGVLWQLWTDFSLFDEVQELWDGLATEAQPTEEEIESLNQIAGSCNMPFMLNSEGLMIGG